MDKNEVICLYRYEFIYISTTLGDKYDLVLESYNIIKKTSKGFWIQSLQSSGNHNVFEKKFVLCKSRKAFAYLTEKEALTNFIHRKKKYIEILSHKVHINEVALGLAKDLLLEKYKSNIMLKQESLHNE